MGKRTRASLIIAFCLCAAQAYAASRVGARGAAPGADLRKLVIWGSECREPEGQGLAFGGQHQTADDGRPHTRVLRDGAWVPILGQLRAKNPLQKHHDRLWALRTALRDALGRARYIYFQGRAAEEETAFLKEQVNPALEALAGDLAKAEQALAALTGLDEYQAGQVKSALAHIKAVGDALKPFAGRTGPDRLAKMRQAQVALELAAEALGAEPPGRVCSPVVYDSKTKRYVLFGGDHFDYLTNDVWVFDPAEQRWFQQHPADAPEPRANHTITADGDGTVTVSGGYAYADRWDYGARPYARMEPGKWVYDLAADAWTAASGGKAFPATTRRYRAERFLPEYYMAGARPDAAAHEATLKAVPANTWVAMKPSKRPQKEQDGRGWGTTVLDPDHDLLLQWGGGHSAAGGTDVLHYHLATNRWEQPYPIEYCLGQVASPSAYPGGYNFNRHPWIIMHAYKSYAYETALKRLVLTGRNINWKYRHDTWFYLYDPLIGEWTTRHPLNPKMLSVHYFLNSRVIAGPAGLLFWGKGSTAFRLNCKALTWEQLKFEGALPTAGTDGGGLVYDPKRNRMLMVTKPWKPQNQGIFSGTIHVLDLKTMKASALQPKGAGKLKTTFLREAAYNPEADLFLWAWRAKGRMLAYDPAGNRWVTLAIGGSAPFGFSTGHVYDAKRGLHWVAGGGGAVYCLRLDAATADVQDVK